MERRCFLATSLAAGAVQLWPRASAAAAELPTRTLGRTGVSLSLLGFGCTDVRERAVYRRALDLGVTHFHIGDRAPEPNWDACAALRDERRRLAIGYMSMEKASAGSMRADLQRFLRRSGLGHVDVWYVVTPTPEQREMFATAAAAERQAGNVRATAFSSHRMAQDLPSLTAPGSPFDAVMLTHNALSAAESLPQVEALHAAGVGVVPMKPLAGRFHEPGSGRPDALLRWLFRDARLASVPVIMTSVIQVERNVAALGRPYGEDDERALAALRTGASARFCRMCGTCDGRCPAGLAVSDLVRAAMYAEGYGDTPRALAQLAEVPEAARDERCADCATCAVRCPYGVDVRQRVTRAQALTAPRRPTLRC